MQHIDGDLIKLAKEGKFDGITHGCNCFCVMGAGIAVPMRQNFHVSLLEKEKLQYKGDYNKLGTIDFGLFDLNTNGLTQCSTSDQNVLKLLENNKNSLFVINCYTQYHFSAKVHKDTFSNTCVDYQAIGMCFKKINHIFKGKTIGIPKIGAGLAGGNWKLIENIINDNTPDVNIVCVNYVP